MPYAVSHKEMTAHIRNRIKVAGIRAKVRASVSCGSKVIDVISPTYEQVFTAEQRRAILHIAECNRLTFVRGIKIDINSVGNPNQISLYLPE